jgi:Arc/MetJ family transcription regulator
MTTSRETPESQQTRCVCDVYDAAMARTNIDVDEEAVRRVMERYGFKTMKEAVNYALNRLVPRKATREEFLAAEGIGWDGDLEQMRGQK